MIDKLEHIWAWGVVSALISFFSPISIMIHVIVAVIILDTITAILRDMVKAKEIEGFLNKLRIIKSNKLRKTALKLIFFTLMVMIVYTSEIAIFGVSVYITNFVTFLIVFSELTSVAENCDLITESNKFTSIITKVQKLFEKKISNQVDREEDK